LVVIFIQCANEMSRLFMRGNYGGLVEDLSEIIPIGIDLSSRHPRRSFGARP
jgi:hypothetical protein